MIKSLARMGVTSKPRMILGTGSPLLPGPQARPQSRADRPARRAQRPHCPSGGHARASAAARPAAWSRPAALGRGERPAPLRGAGLLAPWEAERGAGPVLISAAPPPHDAVISPQTGQPQGRRHIRSPLPRSGARKQSGHAGLPAGVVPAAPRVLVCNTTRVPVADCLGGGRGGVLLSALFLRLGSAGAVSQGHGFRRHISTLGGRAYA